MLLSCEVPGSQWLALRTQIQKFALASVDLLVKDARGNSKLQSLKEHDLLQDSEIKFLTTIPISQRPIVMWSWILSACLEAMKRAKTPPPHFGAIQRECTAARVGIQTSHTYLTTQLPFAYVHLITFLVNVQNIVVAVKSGVVFAGAYYDNDASIMVNQVIMCVTVCMIYQGLLAISYVIHDPFGEDVLDFPIMAYSEYVAQSCDATYLAQDNLFFMHPERELFPEPAVASPPAKPAFTQPERTKDVSESEQIQLLRKTLQGMSQKDGGESEQIQLLRELCRGMSALVQSANKMPDSIVDNFKQKPVDIEADLQRFERISDSKSNPFLT
jgi:hypothetical protein